MGALVNSDFVTFLIYVRAALVSSWDAAMFMGLCNLNRP